MKCIRVNFFTGRVYVDGDHHFSQYGSHCIPVFIVNLLLWIHWLVCSKNRKNLAEKQSKDKKVDMDIKQLK